MGNNQGLQKLTKITDSVKSIMELPTITVEEVDKLSKEERTELISVLNDMSRSKGKELDNYRAKMDGLLSDDDRNSIWESNHNRITAAISNLMQQFGRMPICWEISEESGLSRQTVHKHMKEYANDPRYLEIREQHRFMVDKVLARVFYYAVNGDMRAAKLYLSAMGVINNPRTVNTLNNYVQINNTILSQEIVEKLTPDQIASIEAILTIS